MTNEASQAIVLYPHIHLWPWFILLNLFPGSSRKNDKVLEETFCKYSLFPRVRGKYWYHCYVKLTKQQQPISLA